jgi:hypothetical protein
MPALTADRVGEKTTPAFPSAGGLLLLMICWLPDVFR